MENSQVYRMKVKATYKDYAPIDFDLVVNYISNLDGKIKFVDLGTHVFYKNGTQKMQQNMKFSLHSVTDTLADDDLDNYQLSIKDELGTEYIKLEDQQNIIELKEQEIIVVPKVGGNVARVSSPDYLVSQKQFIYIKGQPTDIEIPLVSALKEGEMAVVLTWTQGSSVIASPAGNMVEL